MGIKHGAGFNYKAVAASQTTSQLCGQGGWVECITVIPASSTPQAVTLLDGTTAVYTSAVGAGDGTYPYTVWIRGYATSTKGWVITTGASVSVIVSGNANPRDDM